MSNNSIIILVKKFINEKIGIGITCSIPVIVFFSQIYKTSCCL